MSSAWVDTYDYLMRPVLIYFAALLAVRLMGKRALGQLSLFDLVVMVGIGDVIVLVGLERKVSVLEGIIMLGIFGVLEIALSMLTFRWKWIARLVEGRPTILVHEGRVIRRNLTREHISLRDLKQELRKKGYANPADTKEVVLEACGKISVISDEEEEDKVDLLLRELSSLRQEVRSLAEKLKGGDGT